MLGQILTYYIYIRNLQLQKEWHKFLLGIRWIMVLTPIGLLIIGYFRGELLWNSFTNKENIATWLLLLGILSQVIFTFRFIYQWIYSERIKLSILPIGFWRFSTLGTCLILVYAIFRKDSILLIGHGSGLFFYLRNIFLWNNQEQNR